MQTALVTVVHVEGSSYRRAGARMLVRDDGELTGAISGGCLEGDALRKAMLALSQQQTKLITYDTSDEEDAAIGLQLGCEGIIQVLFEPINDQKNPIEFLRKVVSIRQHAVLITLFSLVDKRNKQVGTSLLLEENGNVSGNIEDAELKDKIVKDAKSALQQKKSVFKTYTTENNSVTAFIEFFKPPVSLIIIGAGNDALPVTQIADLLGWEVRVVDGRTTHARPERFVSACQVLVSNPENVLEEIPVDSNTAFVLMTHNYNYDKAMLKALLQKEVEYIGVLGPKKKLKKMLDELKDEGIELSDNHLKKIYGPAGLEIGAETPEEIALSIIAEIKAVFSKKTGGSLRNKKEVIHSRKDTLIESKELF
jgi:xanthine/CO dehydrogenase XdhC/CoxF family maturation factor